MTACPAGCGNTVEHYLRARRCRECGWHVDLQKRKSTDGDRALREEARRFSFDPRYPVSQVTAMAGHLARTNALDRTDVAPHDAFGKYTGTITQLRGNL